MTDRYLPISIFIALICIALLPSTYAADIQTLTGKTLEGPLTALDATTAKIEVEGKSESISVSDLMKIDFSSISAGSIPTDAEPIDDIELTDSSSLRGQNISCDGLEVKLDSFDFNAIKIPFRSVKSVLFNRLDETTSPQWGELLAKEVSDDMLVVKKGDVFDYLPGVVTEFNADTVTFLYQGNEIPVRREKVFGLIFPRLKQTESKAVCKVITTRNEQLLVGSIELVGENFELSTGPNQRINIPKANVASLDFSLGRIVYLSDLAAEGVEYTPFFDIVWEIQRDRGIEGKTLSLGQTEYQKGLWIHSRTNLSYRLAGEYSRFQAMIGIDDSVSWRGLGHVRLVISGDEEVLFDEIVTGRQKPRPIDLEISNYRFLKILVDFGEQLDIGDRLILANARFIK